MDGYQAPLGTVWVCPACGKRASNRANGGISRGWDVSCFLHALLCKQESVVLNDGKVIKADVVEINKEADVQ